MLDGIHGMLPREKMSAGVRKLRDFYDGKPGAPFVLKEFGFYSLDRWIKEGHIKSPEEIEGDYDAYLREVFGFDEPGQHDIWNLGWCEAEFCPFFEEKTIEDRGDHEVVQDFAGRHVLFFKNRRSGFMPEYISSPVKDMKTWQEKVKWRLNPDSPERIQKIDKPDCAGSGQKVSKPYPDVSGVLSDLFPSNKADESRTQCRGNVLQGMRYVHAG